MAPISPVKDENDPLRRLAYYRQNFEPFARDCLKLRNKHQMLVPFTLNPVQRILHNAAEQQLAEIGKVRIIVIKSRRAGSSTYILGRGYWRSTLKQGVSVAIAAHQLESANTLYRIVKRFQDHNPIAPELGRSNIRGLDFEGMDSRYAVFSAENEQAGRGEEISMAHFSEADFYSSLENVMAGLGNCVSDVPGSEIWIETTADKPFGPVHKMCDDAVAGKTQYRLVFIPWFVDPENAAHEVDSGFTPSSERENDAFLSETELKSTYNLTDAQILFWRRKVSELGIIRAVREFPYSYEAAFLSADRGSFIKPDAIQRALDANIHPTGAKVIGVDPSSMGGDRFVIACGRGRKTLWIKSRVKVPFNEGMEWLRAVLEDEKPDRMNIDAGGGGNGNAYSSALRDDPKYENIVRGVNFGGQSQHKMARPDMPGPVNRKAEMAGRLRDMMESEEGYDLPKDTPDLAQDLAAPEVEFVGPEGDWRLKPKAKLKGRSHDLFDAICLLQADRYVRPLHDENKTSIFGDQSVNGLPPSSLGWQA